MVPKVFEPMKFYCVAILKIRRVNRSNNNNIIHLGIVKQSLAISRDLAFNESALKTRKVSGKVVSNKHSVCQINPLLFLYPLNHENGTCLDSRQGTSMPRLDCTHGNLIKICVWFSIIKVVIYGGSEVDRPNLAYD